jgi:hypothetical protein
MEGRRNNYGNKKKHLPQEKKETKHIQTHRRDNWFDENSSICSRRLEGECGARD